MKLNKLASILWILMLALWGTLLWSCADKPAPPTSVPTGDLLEKPFNLATQVGDSKITLSWEVSDPASVQKFNVYRRSEEDDSARLIGSVEVPTFTDTGLSNGIEYTYQVAGVSKNNIEGAFSDPIRAIPNLFAVIIESGGDYTNSRSVTLNFTAPERTSFLKISNDPTLSDAQFEPFVSSKTWLLSPGDGLKTVYVVYRDELGSETTPPVKDMIILDTQAIIFEVSENTNGRVIASGETIHFRLDAQETGGSASVTLQDGPSIALFDDGRAGDPTAGDGIYERDYTVPFGVQTNKATVSGRFVDIAGNQATPVNAPGLVTVQTPPAPVTLLKPNPSDATFSSINITWSPNTDSDFTEYRVFRSTSSGVNQGSTFVGSVSEQSTTSFVDTNLDEDREYFYVVYVLDNFGLSSASNEVSIRTKTNERPKAVTLFPPAPDASDSTALNISWTQNNDTDFSQYRVFRGTTPGVDSTSTVVTAIFSQSQTNFLDTNLIPGRQYYYRVYVFDQNGLSTGSNEESGTLP